MSTKADKALFSACNRGDLNDAKRAIDSGANMNCSWFSDTPLHIASSGGHEAVVDMLLKAKVNPSAADGNGDTPLHNASSEGHEAVVDMLLKAKVNPSATDKKGDTPLHYASSGGHEAVVDVLLKAKTNPSAANKKGDTPLHYASSGGHEAVVDMLLKAKANLSAADGNGDTPLHNASSEGHEAVVNILLKANANPSAANKNGGDTPLHNASSKGHEAVVDMLLKAKANPSAANKYGDTPLHNASSKGHEAVVDMLLKAKPNLSAKNFHNDDTPLHNASSRGDEALVHMLLKAKANPSAANKYGYTPLHYASYEGHEAVVDMLLKAKANPSAANEMNGYTPLHIASSGGHEAVVDMLLKAKSNLSAKTFHYGNTPLHMAAQGHHVSVMELLIKHGADIDDTNKYGNTPQSYLFKADSNEMKMLDVAEKKRRQDEMKNLLKCCQENESVDLLLVKCVLTGLPRVGKTSFLKRIRRKMNRFTVPLVIPSTGFEAPVTVNIADDPVTVNTAVIKKGRWFPTDDLHEEGNVFLRSIKHSKTQPKVDHQPRGASPSIKVAQDLPRPSFSIVQSVKNLIIAKDDLKSAKSFIEASAHPKYVQELEDVDSLTQVYFIDTGGQVEFHELLPPLLHGSAFHLMFFNASLSLHKAVEVVYRHNDSSISSVRYKTSSSSIEIIQQLLVSFYTLNKKANHQSVAGLFGSYIDQLSSDPEELSKQLQEISSTFEAQFRGTSFHEHKFLAQPLNEDCPIIFQPLDNIACSEDELEKAEKFIYDVIQERFSPVTLPVCWAIFHLSLRNEYEAQGVCTIEECTSLAIDCRIPAEHVPRVLEFFHSQLGTVLYYNEISSLKNYVIINPNILFSGISKLVTLSFIGSGERYGITQTMRKTGEIATIDLHLHEPLSENCPLTNQHIVDLLVHYELLHVSSESTFFMPCLLLPDPEVVSSLVSFDILSFSPPPMLILFNEGFVPIGLFSGIVNGLLKKWELDRANRFRNHVKFLTPPGCVELRHCLKYIEIRAVGGIDKHCNKVREEVMEVVKQVVSVQPHLNETKYCIGFYCPGSLSSHLHACKYNCSFEKALVCTKHEKCFDSRLVSSSYALWFEESSSSKSPTSEVPEALATSSPVIDLTLVDDSELKKDSLLSILGDCYDIVDWNILGCKLGVSEAELYRIRVDEPNELSRQKEMFSRWIDSGHASWRGLVDALLYPPLKANRVASDIATRHPVKHD